MKPQQRFHIDDFIRNFKQKANNNNFNAIAQKEDRQKRDMLQTSSNSRIVLPMAVVER